MHEVIGKGSYGTVCAATDNQTGERVAIKRISNVFDNVADAVRILREVKLLRLLRHPDVVQVRVACACVRACGVAASHRVCATCVRVCVRRVCDCAYVCGEAEG